MEILIRLSIILLGFTAVSSQVIFLREFLSAFYGNELSVGLVLAGWLLGGAVGGIFFGRLADKVRSKTGTFTACQGLAAVILFLDVVLIREIRPLLGINIGEAISPFYIFLLSLFVFIPASILLSFMFALACGMYKPDIKYGMVRIANVYVLDSLGAMAGGLVVGTILVNFFNAFHIMGFLGATNLAIAILMSEKNGAAVLGVFIIALLLGPFGAGKKIHEWTLQSQWPGYKIIASENSRYGAITAAERLGQLSFFESGLHLYTTPDEQTAEDKIHFALLEHPDPKDVLLIGGGIGGVLKEAMKHPIRNLTYVELDPKLVKVEKQVLPEEYKSELENPKLNVIHEDGRRFVKRTNTRYDCVIICLGDPVTAQINRYYTTEFFGEARKILKKGGLVSFTISSQEDYINKELSDLFGSLYNTLKASFISVLVLPGNTAHFLASDSPILTDDYKNLVDRIKTRNLDTKYVNEHYLFSRLSERRLAYLKRIVEAARQENPLNRDLRPSSYYLAIISWMKRFGDSAFAILLKSLKGTRLWISFSLVYLFIIFFGLLLRNKKTYPSKIAVMTMAITGFSSMSFQMIMLLGFQFIYGYLFYKIGGLLAAYMAGLALGAFLACFIPDKWNSFIKALVASEIIACLYILAAPSILSFFSRASETAPFSPSYENLFIILPFGFAAVCGFQFPIANRLCLEFGYGVGKSSGLNYGADLLGAFMGALLTGVIFIPLVGIEKSCYFLAMLNAALLFAIFLMRKGSACPATQ